MCVVWGGGKLGLSYYEVDMAVLHIMPDVAESQDFGLLKRGVLVAWKIEDAVYHIIIPIHVLGLSCSTQQTGGVACS